MSKPSYRELLLDPRWQKKRLQVLERDGWKCVDCGTGERTLHVHHSHYRDDADGPWDYEDHTLITLCSECHEAEQQELRFFKGNVLAILARSGFVHASEMDRAACAVSPHGRPFSNGEAHRILNIIELTMISRSTENDGGDLWRNFSALLEPYSSYPQKKDDAL